MNFSRLLGGITRKRYTIILYEIKYLSRIFLLISILSMYLALSTNISDDNGLVIINESLCQIPIIS